MGPKTHKVRGGGDVGVLEEFKFGIGKLLQSIKTSWAVYLGDMV
jgi:hypothetical protein